MKITISLLVVLCLSGCSGGMTNEEIIIEKDKCLKAGMDYTIWLNGLTYTPIKVVCKKVGANF